jgi:hypothetical protein
MIFIWLKHNVYRIYSALRSNPNQRKILKALLSNAFKIFLEARLILHSAGYLRQKIIFTRRGPEKLQN